MSTENELLALNERWIRAWFDKDAATVGRLVSDDYVYVAPNGQILDRDALMAIISSPGYELRSGERSEVIVRLIGETGAIIRFKWQGEGSYEGRSFKDDQVGMMICARENGGWKVVMEQSSNNG